MARILPLAGSVAFGGSSRGGDVVLDSAHNPLTGIEAAPEVLARHIVDRIFAEIPSYTRLLARCVAAVATDPEIIGCAGSRSMIAHAAARGVRSILRSCPRHCS